MSLHTVLQNIGLNEKEASVYLASLELGKSTVLQVSHKSGIKRPTCYLILNELHKKGIISFIQEGQKAFYLAIKPEIIQSNLESKLDGFKKSLPLLQSLAQSHSHQQYTYQLWDKISIRKEIASHLSLFNEFEFLGNIELLYRDIFDNDDLIQIISSLHSKQIIKQSNISSEYISHLSFNTHDIRFFSDNSDISSLILCNNRVFLIQTEPDIMLNIIENRSIYNLFHLFFQNTWNLSIPFVPRGTLE